MMSYFVDMKQCWGIPGGDNTCLTHSAAKRLLDDASIAISSTGNCYDQSNRKCTSLHTIRYSSAAVIDSEKQLILICTILQ